MALQLLSKSYGTAYAGFPVQVKTSGGPARIYATARGGVLSKVGRIVLDATGSFAVYVDDSSVYQTVILDKITGNVVTNDHGLEAGPLAQAPVSGGGTNYIRWCIPGRDTSGTLFKDVSGKGADGTINASNTTPFAVDNRISTVAHASAGGVTVPLAATLCDFLTDSVIMAAAMTRANPAGDEVLISWGAGSGAGFPGFYFGHQAAGVGRFVVRNGGGAGVVGPSSSIAFSNAGGTRETHVLVGYDAPTKSLYLYRDGVLAVSSTALMTGANVWVAPTIPTLGARLGGAAGSSATFASVFRGWQGYVFAGSGLPLNIGKIAAILAEAPSIPLPDTSFTFA